MKATVNNLKINHLNKGEVVAEGSFDSDCIDTIKLSHIIADIVCDNLSETGRFDVHTLHENEIYYGDENEEGFCDSLIVNVDCGNNEGEYTFTVSHN